MGSGASHRSFVVVDVESYGDPVRTSAHRTAVRQGLYGVLVRAFADCDLPWDDKARDDAGDAVMVLLPADTPKDVLVEQLPERLVAALREHNHIHSSEARLRLRMAVHAGEVHYDEHGKTSAEMIFTYRILDAPEAKRALRESAATLLLIASDPFYRAVVRHEPAARPEAFRRIDADVKETRAEVWIRLVDDDRPFVPATAPRRRPEPARQLGAFADALLRVPGFDTPEGRNLVVRGLPFAGVVPRHAAARADAISILMTCEHYPEGLEALVEQVRLYAEGTTAMAELDELMARRGAG
ncbi:effector-associated domain 2-containing protein [Saccharothrix syringae]|uniref:Effector-associated domain-containing protein n=1 Tax=Saccharothrix syringae TaxID=103733 RepID=A0A5Q0GWB0_SACSY|nr:hypothetical protein [Saccharothrix syringae]QFZ18183.1 hypothetical protein EKG83_12435 [Saccharothrix syringae]